MTGWLLDELLADTRTSLLGLSSAFTLDGVRAGDTAAGDLLCELTVVQDGRRSHWRSRSSQHWTTSPVRLWGRRR
jgi:hypothetical protein